MTESVMLMRKAIVIVSLPIFRLVLRLLYLIYNIVQFSTNPFLLNDVRNVRFI